MEYREGDFIETPEGLIFGVKGLMHPERGAIAFVRYIPSEDGDREKDGRIYKKIYDLKERFNYLKNNFPKYLFYSNRLNRDIQLVSSDNVKSLYRPEDRLNEFMKRKNELSQIEEFALEISRKIIDESGIEKGRVGITGSLLVGLEKDDSDIDIVVYGEEAGRNAYSALKKLKRADEDILTYDSKNALRMAKFRWGNTGLSLEKLAEIEKKKVLHGLFEGKDFFVRLVKDDVDFIPEYEKFSCEDFGKVEIEATVTEDDDSIFTPVRYPLSDCEVKDSEDTDIREIVSYRGRFTEQAEKGDRIRARGKLEKVNDGAVHYWRLILGSSEDYLIPAEML